jgi:hypothetical protein
MKPKVMKMDVPQWCLVLLVQCAGEEKVITRTMKDRLKVDDLSTVPW